MVVRKTTETSLVVLTSISIQVPIFALFRLVCKANVREGTTAMPERVHCYVLILTNHFPQ